MSRHYRFLKRFLERWIRVEELWWIGEPRGILIPFEGTRYGIRVSKMIHFYNGPNNINSSVFFFFNRPPADTVHIHRHIYIYRHRHWQSCHRRENSLLPKAWRIWQTRPNDERLAQNRTPSICMHTPAEFCQLSKQVSQGGSINVGNAWEVQLGVVIDNKQNNRDCVGVARTTTREGLKTTGQRRSAALHTGAQCFVVLQPRLQTNAEPVPRVTSLFCCLHHFPKQPTVCYVKRDLTLLIFSCARQDPPLNPAAPIQHNTRQRSGEWEGSGNVGETGVIQQTLFWSLWIIWIVRRRGED